ncbi:hypothetical protein [Sedimenticola hydrogenitrophicus]|uniref:hypothetical protein n=1 Tax=Sedimenticola hydrogenitrophicus TaxID=2967975 RepID=UPI0023AF22CA|nr:hypothetical protein [Sedimenticola hydrogenitrophicus]
MKKLTAATFAVLASFITSGVAVAATIDQETDLIYGNAYGAERSDANWDFRSMPATAAGRESVTPKGLGATHDQETDLIYGNAYAAERSDRDFRSMPATAAGRESMRANEEVIPKVLLGTTNDPMGSNQ